MADEKTANSRKPFTVVTSMVVDGDLKTFTQAVTAYDASAAAAIAAELAHLNLPAGYSSTVSQATVFETIGRMNALFINGIAAIRPPHPPGHSGGYGFAARAEFRQGRHQRNIKGSPRLVQARTTMLAPRSSPVWEQASVVAKWVGRRHLTVVALGAGPPNLRTHSPGREL